MTAQHGCRLLAALDHLWRVSIGALCTASMLPKMLSEVRAIGRLLGGGTCAWQLLHLVSTHATSQEAAVRMGCSTGSAADPRTHQGQLLGLLDSALIMLLAGSMPDSTEGQGDPRVLSTVLLTVALQPLRKEQNWVKARKVATHMPRYHSNPSVHLTLQLDAANSQMPKAPEAQYEALHSKFAKAWALPPP